MFIELIYMSSYINYQSEITIISRKKWETHYVWQRRTQTNFTVVCGLKAELDAIRFWAIFVWLAITIASISCTTVQTLADSLCVVFVADFLRFSLNHCKETRMEIFIMTSESCAMMYFCRKETLPMRFSLVFKKYILFKNYVKSHVWWVLPIKILIMYVYMYVCTYVCTYVCMCVCVCACVCVCVCVYVFIYFIYCSTVIAVSQVSIDKFLVSLVSNYHISYRDDFILSLLNTTWRAELAKSLSSNTLSTQLSTVLSNFICSFFNSGNSLRNFSTVQNQSHRSGNTGKSGGAIRCPVQITHLLNFSTVFVLLNTNMVLELLSVVVNNSKELTLSTVWEKWRRNNTPSASSSHLVKKHRDRTHHTDLWSLLVY